MTRPRHNPCDETHEPTAIGVRVYAPAPARTRRGRRPRPRTAAPRWPEAVLAFDVETDTTPAQRLLYGYYQLGRWCREASGFWIVDVIEEGWFFADDLPTRDPAAYALVGAHVARARAALPPERRSMLHCYSRRAFVTEVFLKAAVDARALVVGFNLPFDLSHVAERWSRARMPAPNAHTAGGFSLELLRAADGSKLGQVPRIKIKHQDRTKAIIQFDRAFRGHFLDLKTLAKALTDRHHSLKSAGAAFAAPVLKADFDDHGVISPEALAYNQRDVQATVALLEAMRVHVDRHPIPTPAQAMRSPATIAKAYLRAMGITPPADRFTGSPEDLGAAFAAFHGGRVEANIRGTVVPVRACDFSSMYPAVFKLTNQQAYLTAATLATADCTEAARRVLRRVTRKRLLAPACWPTLRFLALVEPDGDLLPVRAKYAGPRHGYSTGLNHLTSPVPIWVTGFDLALSVLRTGRQPRVRRAIRLVATGVLPGLTPVLFRGAVPIDPRDSIIDQFITQRHRAKTDATLSAEERQWLPDQLKVTANIIAFGLFAETNAQSRSRGDRVRVPVHGAGKSFTTATAHPEEPGSFCFPFIAAYVTGAARLLLGLAEILVTDRGGVVLAKDTDSLHIVAAPRRRLVPCLGGPRRMQDGRAAVLALSYADVDAITDTLQPLMPFPALPHLRLLKVEDVNFAPGTRTPVALWGLARAAKRYCLFERLSGGRFRFRRTLETGLGQYRAPMAAPTASDAERYPEDQGWIAEVWRWIVHRALGRRRVQSPVWFRQPALSQLAITSPADLEALERATSPLVTRPYAEAVKPLNFMLSGQLADGEIPPPGCDPQRFRPIAAFSRDPGAWATLAWVDAYSGTPLAVTARHSGFGSHVIRLKTIGEVVEAYERHPEAKSLGPDGQPCAAATRGLLRPRSVQVHDLVALGKDTHRFESILTGQEAAWEDAQLAYVRTDRPPLDADLRRCLDSLTTDAAVQVFAEQAGVSARTIYRLKEGRAVRGSSRETTTAAARLTDVSVPAAGAWCCCHGPDRQSLVSDPTGAATPLSGPRTAGP